MTRELPPVPTPRTADVPPEVRVIHVDDDSGFVEMSSEFLERADDRIDVRTETDPRAVVDAVRDFDPHCIVSDYDMPVMNGLDLSERVREADIEVPFILFTGKGSESIAAEAMTVGVTDYIQKGGTDTYELVANRVLDAVKSRQRKIAVDRAVNHYTALVETAHVPVYLYDEGATIQYANEASAELFGVDDPDAVVGESFFDLLPENTHEEIRSRLSRLEAEEQVPETEFEFEDLQGTPRRIRISCAPTPHHDEAVGQTIAHDVMRAEENRRELETFRRVVGTALREAGAGLWMHDRRTDSVTRYGVVDILGVEPSALEDALDSFLAHVHPDDRDRLRAAYDAAAERGESFCVDFRTETDEGVTRHLEDRGAVVTDDDGSVTYVIGMVVDVTERERQERQLLRERDQLEEMATLLSHDLGNALETAEGYLTLAAEDDGGERLRDARTAVERAAEMTDALADVARAGKPVTDVTELSLAEAAEAARRTTSLPEGQLEVRGDAVLRADEEAFGRLLENLFTNAVDHGGTDVSVEVGRCDDGFYVADDGPGLPETPDDLLAFGVTTSPEGDGVGLASVQHIARSHGWDVQAVDAEDGARFEVTGVEIRSESAPVPAD